MDIILNGACGRMGAAVRELIEAGARPGLRLAAGIDPSADAGDPKLFGALEEYTGRADVIIDFSHHTCTAALTEYAVARSLPLVIATTGQTDEETAQIKAASEKIPVFLSANFSLGIAVLARFARAAAAIMPDAEVEIIETHHDRKLDAPSGTALALARAVRDSIPDAEPVFGRSGHKKRAKNEIGIHSLRIGGVVGEHEVIISSGNEIISLKHKAESRTLFAEGALTAASFLVGKPAGMYTMDDVAAE